MWVYDNTIWTLNDESVDHINMWNIPRIMK